MSRQDASIFTDSFKVFTNPIFQDLSFEISARR